MAAAAVAVAAVVEVEEEVEAEEEEVHTASARIGISRHRLTDNSNPSSSRTATYYSLHSRRNMHTRSHNRQWATLLALAACIHRKDKDKDKVVVSLVICRPTLIPKHL